MDKVKFKKQVVPGDQLVMTAFVKRRGTIAVVEAKAEVDGKLCSFRNAYFCNWKLRKAYLCFVDLNRQSW